MKMDSQSISRKSVIWVTIIPIRATLGEELALHPAQSAIKSFGGAHRMSQKNRIANSSAEMEYSTKGRNATI